jgi:hypothetical protein
MRNDIPLELKRRGFELDIRDPYSFYLGCVQLVMRERGELIGVADPRRDGAAGGPALTASAMVLSRTAKAARKTTTTKAKTQK